MKEKYIYWKISDIVADDYSVKTIVYGREGIAILLESLEDREKDIIRLNFGASIDLYRVCDEGVRQKLYEQLDSFLGPEWPMYGRRFLVENSQLIKWIQEESGYLKDFDLKHFVLMNNDSVFDIVTRCITEIEYLQ